MNFKEIADTSFKEIYKRCTNKPYSFLTINTTLPAYDPLRFERNFSGAL